MFRGNTNDFIDHPLPLYPHMGPPTTRGAQALHHLNPALGFDAECSYTL